MWFVRMQYGVYVWNNDELNEIIPARAHSVISRVESSRVSSEREPRRSMERFVVYIRVYINQGLTIFLFALQSI